eukprot:PhM_4_TR9339/c0_g1_i1/m.76996/K03241/EIF2B3; translation initiation factor eIF-2B subunit gamma
MQQVDVVVLALDSGEVMNTLCVDYPPSCLPIVSTPIICKTLEVLREQGVNAPVNIVTSAHFADSIRRTLTTYFGEKENLWTIHITGYAADDALAAVIEVEKHLTRDVLVLDAETLVGPSVSTMVNGFFMNSSSFSLLMKQRPNRPVKGEAPEPPNGLCIPDEDAAKEAPLFVALDSNGTSEMTSGLQRLRFYHSANVTKLTLRSNFLMLNPCVSMTTQLKNLGVFVMKRWLLKWLAHHRQKQDPPLQSMDDVIPFLVAQQSLTGCEDAADRLICGPQSWHSYNSVLNDRAVSTIDVLANSHTQRNDFYHPIEQVRCHAFVLPKSEDVNRVCNYNTFSAATLSARRSAEATHTEEFLHVHPSLQGNVERCTFGKCIGVRGESTLKQSVFGHNVHIGDKCRVMNSVLMDQVVLGECCRITNCIIAANCTIPSHSILVDCVIGFGVSELPEQKMKGKHVMKPES